MYGLSGMKIYSKFFIDTAFLPANYPDNAEFLIKGVEHRIENNKWFTKIESFVITTSDTKTQNLSKKIDIYPVGETKSAPTNVKSASSVNGQWATELRKVLARLGYAEKGSEIDNGGDISENIYKAAASLFTTIKSELPLSQIRVTGGNDVFHIQNHNLLSEQLVLGGKLKCLFLRTCHSRV